MKKMTVILLFYCIAFLIVSNCSSHVVENENTQSNSVVLDSLNNKVKSEHIDTVDIVQLTKTKWKYTVTTDCITYLTFTRDNTYQEDNCEWGLLFEGTYKVSKDTIFLMEYGLASEVPGENRVVNTALYTYLYKKDSLLFISNQRIEEGKVVSTYVPETPIYYKKEK